MENGGHKIKIIIKTPVHPTEDRLKVAECLFNITQISEVEEESNQGESFLVVKSSDKKILSIIREKLRRQRILDSARKLLVRKIAGEYLKFMLNKQAAFTGRIHFVKDPENEDFLGPIYVTIISNGIEEIIEWLTKIE